MRVECTCPDGAVGIPLRRRDGTIRAYAVVDAADAEWVNQWRWSLCSAARYAIRTARHGGSSTTVYLHRELLNLMRGDLVEVDHINRDTLDDRRINLRTTTRAGNTQNIPSIRNTTSKYRGVYWDKDTQKWRAEVEVGGRRYKLGRFTDERQAGEAAQAARLRLMPYATD